MISCLISSQAKNSGIHNFHLRRRKTKNPAKLFACKSCSFLTKILVKIHSLQVYYRCNQNCFHYIIVTQVILPILLVLSAMIYQRTNAKFQKATAAHQRFLALGIEKGVLQKEWRLSRQVVHSRRVIDCRHPS